MNNNIRIAKELVRIAKMMVAGVHFSDSKFEFSTGKVILYLCFFENAQKCNQAISSLYTDADFVESFGDLIDKGDWTVIKSEKGVYATVEVKFDDSNTEDHKSPKAKMQKALEGIGFTKGGPQLSI